MFLLTGTLTGCIGAGEVQIQATDGADPLTTVSTRIDQDLVTEVQLCPYGPAALPVICASDHLATSRDRILLTATGDRITLSGKAEWTAKSPLSETLSVQLTIAEQHEDEIRIIKREQVRGESPLPFEWSFEDLRPGLSLELYAHEVTQTATPAGAGGETGQPYRLQFTFTERVAAVALPLDTKESVVTPFTIDSETPIFACVSMPTAGGVCAAPPITVQQRPFTHPMTESSVRATGELTWTPQNALSEELQIVVTIPLESGYSYQQTVKGRSPLKFDVSSSEATLGDLHIDVLGAFGITGSPGAMIGLTQAYHLEGKIEEQSDAL